MIENLSLSVFETFYITICSTVVILVYCSLVFCIKNDKNCQIIIFFNEVFEGDEYTVFCSEKYGDLKLVR